MVKKDTFYSQPIHHLNIVFCSRTFFDTFKDRRLTFMLNGLAILLGLQLFGFAQYSIHSSATSSYSNSSFSHQYSNSKHKPEKFINSWTRHIFKLDILKLDEIQT